MAHLGVRSDLSGSTRGGGARGGAPRGWGRAGRVGLLVASIVLIMFSLVAGIQRAHADSVAYLIEVTVRPGYNFANADAALGYGYQVCDKVSAGRGYADLIGDV